MYFLNECNQLNNMHTCITAPFWIIEMLKVYAYTMYFTYMRLQLVGYPGCHSVLTAAFLVICDPNSFSSFSSKFIRHIWKFPCHFTKYKRTWHTCILYSDKRITYYNFRWHYSCWNRVHNTLNMEWYLDNIIEPIFCARMAIGRVVDSKVGFESRCADSVC